MQRLMRNDAFALHVGKESSRRVVSNFHNRAGVRLCFAFEVDSSFTTAAGGDTKTVRQRSPFIVPSLIDIVSIRTRRIVGCPSGGIPAVILSAVHNSWADREPSAAIGRALGNGRRPPASTGGIAIL